jgi:hypothetical protein
MAALREREIGRLGYMDRNAGDGTDVALCAKHANCIGEVTHDYDAGLQLSCHEEVPGEEAALAKRKKGYSEEMPEPLLQSLPQSRIS